jgi:acyl-CoA thioester hydrolase
MLKFHNFSQKYRIYYEDTDAGGVMYYANYLKFFERARTDFLRASGVSQNELIQDKNALFVVKKCEIEYFKPAKLDDLVEVFVEVKEIGAASIKMDQQMQLEGKILAKFKAEIVCVDSLSFRPKRIDRVL